MARKRSGSASPVRSGQALLAANSKPQIQKLRPGPGLSAEQVFSDQRHRLHVATITLVDRDGCAGVRVRSIVQTARVSTATFYKHFTNVEDCLGSTYDAVMRTAVRNAGDAQRRETDWRSALRAAVRRLTEDLGSEPGAARLALVDIFDAGPGARGRIGPVVSQLEGLVLSCFAAAPRGVTPPRHLVAGMAAGFLRVARTTTLTDRAAELPAYADELIGWMLSLPGPDVLSLIAPSRLSKVGPGREPNYLPAVSTDGAKCTAGDDRERLQRAVFKLAQHVGLANLTAPRVRIEAGVPRRRFEQCYDSVEDCYLDGIEWFAREAAGRARSWADITPAWEIRACRFVYGVCAQAARGGTRTHLVFQGLLAGGRAGLLRREAMLTVLAATLRASVPICRRPSVIAAEASVAAIWHITQSDVAAGRSRDLPAIAALLSYVALAPVVGSQSAAIEAAGRPRLAFDESSCINRTSEESICI